MQANLKRWMCVMGCVVATAGIGLPYLAKAESAATKREQQAETRAECFLAVARREEALVDEARIRHRDAPHTWSTNFWLAFRIRKLHTATERLVEELGNDARALVQPADLSEAERYGSDAARLAQNRHEREITRTILTQISASAERESAYSIAG
ncbi:MAG: hypothetical protein ACK47B_17935 [Armatimonadota bacterium]